MATVVEGPELLEQDDDLIDGRPRYESCDRCNYADHICPGCGQDLTHSGHERVNGVWRIHGTSCVD